MFDVRLFFLVALCSLSTLGRAQPWQPEGPLAPALAGTPSISLLLFRDRARPTVSEGGDKIASPRLIVTRDRASTGALEGASRQYSLQPGDVTARKRSNAGTPPARVLNVRYVDQVYAQRRLECSGRRVCVWNDCGPASAAMVLHYEGLEPRDVLTNRQATLDLVCETKPGCRGTTNGDRMLATLQNHGLEAYLVDTPSLAEIQASIDRGHPVILSLTPWPDHVMVAVGYKLGDIVVVHDPYGGAFWWRNLRHINEPLGNQPKRTGEAVEYPYASLEPLVIYGLFTTGPHLVAGLASIVPPFSE